MSRFVLTIGATANQNGTAMFEGVTVIFLAQFFGIDLTLGQQLMVMLVCILGGIGTAGVPAGSLPVVALILAMVGIDPQAIALVLGVDRFLDMCRTTLNVTGDLVAAQVISAAEPDRRTRPARRPLMTRMRNPGVLEFGREILHDEARALDALADGLGVEFERAVGLILDCPGKLIVSGLGKSGHVGRKIAATFASTGTTATFLHLAEAIHGDLGMAAKGDVAILISQSGETTELEPVIDHFQRAEIRSSRSPAIRHRCWPKRQRPRWCCRTGPRLVRSGGADDLDDHDARARRCAGDDGDAAERLHPDRFRAAPSRRCAGREAEAGQPSDAQRRRGASDARGRIMHDTIVEMSAKRLGVVGVTDDPGYLVGRSPTAT